MKALPTSLLGLLAATSLYAGAPFLTDDPEPVDFHHWEITASSTIEHDAEGTGGTLGSVEVDYGPVKNVQLHIIAPLAFSEPGGAAHTAGYGDTEVGVKYRFLEETDSHPEAAIFPTVELPTGSSARGLGNGKAQFFLPLWLQKSFGHWTTYGGGGYWFHPGNGNRNFWDEGLLLQNQVTKTVAIGGEIFHQGAQTKDGHPTTRLNFGVVWDLNERYHLLASAGPVVQGPRGYQAYLGWLITLGPPEH